MKRLENVPAMWLNETQELLGVNILKPAVCAAVRAAKPRWHSLGSRSLLPAPSWPGKIIPKWVRTPSLSVWSSKQTSKKGRGTWGEKASTSKQWILGVDQSSLQVLAKNFLLEISILWAGSPAAPCSWDAPDAIQVHPAALSLKQTRPQHICRGWARKPPIAPLAWPSKVDRLRSIRVTPFQMFTGRSFASTPTSLILGKSLWWHRSPVTLEVTQGFIPRMTGVHEPSIHCTARKSIVPDIAQSTQCSLFSCCTDKYPILGSICSFRRSF